mgnify:FL=1|tara:strand:+ start:190 stop:777 length:588 start_codon:yes stop_codon:yes gene_type:complete
MYPDLVSLIIFGFVTAMTPGPNNITSSYSGFNFGYKKTLPLILAVISGWTLLLIIMNTGLILIFRQYPIIQEIIRILGSIFLVYLAYLISFSKPSKAAPIKNPITFSKAFILQFINPKSLVVSMTTVSIFIDPANYLRDSLIVISFFFLMAVLSINSWCLIGMYLRNFATSEKFIRNFNFTMSFLLIVCVIMFYV